MAETDLIDLGPRWPELVPDVKPEELPKDLHDAASRLITMALAEVGYSDRGTYWNGSAYQNKKLVPWQVLYRARELACRKLGLAYHWENEDGELVMEKAAVMREESVDG